TPAIARALPTFGADRVAGVAPAAVACRDGGRPRRSGPEPACKPGSVPAPDRSDTGEDHSSRRRIAAPLERSHPDAGPGLAAGARAGRPRRRPYSSLLREGF